MDCTVYSVVWNEGRFVVCTMYFGDGDEVWIVPVGMYGVLRG